MANYFPTGTSVTDFSSTKFYPEDTITASYSGAVNPITLPAGLYKLECQGAQGGSGYTGTVTSSSSTRYTAISSSDYTTYFSVSNSSYYFSPDDGGTWKATNLGIDNSTSQTTWTCSKAGTYKITYYYITEEGWDKFTLTIDGTTKVSSASGKASNSYTVSLNSGSKIVAKYVKDSSQSVSGEDVYIKIEKQVTIISYTPNVGNSSSGGYGGYSTGILKLNEPTTLYLYVGGVGGYSNSTTTGTTVSGGWNGGGRSYVRYYQSYYSSGGGGGGATDIRIGQDNLYARVIVAGGGGGSAGESLAYSTKYGGGPSGGSAVSEYQATQTAPGTNGSFGVGANATGNANYDYGPGGGGGGWYGGGAATTASRSDAAFRTYNGGGSGYVYTANTASNYPSGCLLNSNYYLYEASTSNGNGYPIAQTTHGAIKITYLAPVFIKTTTTNYKPIKAIYIKTDSTTWKGGEINGYM